MLDVLQQFLPLMIVSIPLAIGNGLIAKRRKESIPFWVIMSLIPGINYLFMLYVAYSTALYLLDRVNKLADSSGITAQIFE
jgi:hypothetical protein